MESNCLKTRRGASIIYIVVAAVALCSVGSLAVDYGKVQLVKSQLQHGAQAAARAGAQALPNIIYGTSAAYAQAAAAATDCTVDGSSLILDQAQDIDIGVWDGATKKFTVKTDPTVCNAVRVRAHHTAARGNPVQLVLARVVGRTTCDANATSVAVLTPGASANYSVNATSSPFLAGEPSGTMSSPNNPHNSPDSAPHDSPPQVTGVSIVPGGSLTFDGINGGANNDYTDPTLYTADGNLGWICNNTAGSEHGLSNMSAPINSLVGVFLSNSLPDNTVAPASLDFSTDSSRDFTTLSPKLQQIFFIGDGRTSSGELQNFVVPTGATRLYIATWDTYEWNNNSGSFSVTAHRTGTVSTVQEQ